VSNAKLDDLAEVSGDGALIVGAPVASILTVIAVDDGAVQASALQSQEIAANVTVTVLAEFPAFVFQSSMLTAIVRV